MDCEKGFLVPINYNGMWTKSSDGCWMYDGLNVRYVRVRSTTTYVELLDLIVAETGISQEENKIEIHGWMSYPVKGLLPPFLILKDMDISTFIELNANRDCVVPLCISTSSIPKLVSPLVEVDDHKVDGVLEEHDSNHKDNDDTFEDSFVNRDPFDCVNHVEDCGDVGLDPSENVVDFDSHFRVYLHSTTAEGNPVHHDIEPINVDIPSASTPVPSSTLVLSAPAPDPDRTSTQTAGSKRGRGRPRGKRIISADAQSTNVNVLQDFRVGEIVKSKDELLLRVRVLSVKANREFKVTHSDQKRFIVACIDKGCKWRLRGTFSRSHCGWSIYSYEKNHNCSIDVRNKAKRGAATAETIAHLIKNDETTPGRIQEMLESKYGVNISYAKAWKAKEIAGHLVRGTPEASSLDRSKNKRIPSQGEEKVRRRCGYCGEYGHNKKTCKGDHLTVEPQDK